MKNKLILFVASILIVSCGKRGPTFDEAHPKGSSIPIPTEPSPDPSPELTVTPEPTVEPSPSPTTEPSPSPSPSEPTELFRTCEFEIKKKTVNITCDKKRGNIPLKDFNDVVSVISTCGLPLLMSSKAVYHVYVDVSINLLRLDGTYSYEGCVFTID